MLKIKTSQNNKVGKVTFALPANDHDQRVSVVGDFNEWDPLVHPLKRRSNGSRSVTVDLALGASYHFKYLADDGSWFCDPDLEECAPNEYGELNSVLHLS